VRFPGSGSALIPPDSAAAWYRVEGLGFGSFGSGVKVRGSGVQSLGFEVWGLRFGVWGWGVATSEHIGMSTAATPRNALRGFGVWGSRFGVGVEKLG
jgi:hypothetical protein